MTEDFEPLGYVAVSRSRVYDGQFRFVATPIIREESPVEEFPPPRYRIGLATGTLDR